ncbi:hypothetical protein [Kurthia senegalensis]|uniref:hypothetical protein n=1 Tax=Kurthia senegalensis TaxID=1033740 RepID=UPI0011CAC886|nr:hypothetical protein [Kurthia senegalensis]
MTGQRRFQTTETLFMPLLASLYVVAMLLGIRDAWQLTRIPFWTVALIPITVFLLSFFNWTRFRFFMTGPSCYVSSLYR